MKVGKCLTKITDINKLYLEKVINKGDIVVDATMGNGYDTKYLAEKVGEEGFVYSFDIQETALKSTKKRLDKENLSDRVKLILDGHENMDKYVEGEVSCVLFNLGYLPRADHNIYGRTFQTVPVSWLLSSAGLIRFRSPLLSESRLISFPEAT